MALIQDNALSTETEALTLMLQEILTDSESDIGQSYFKEETIEKLMQELYKEIVASPPSPKPPSPRSMEFEDAHDQKTYDGDFDEEWLARVLSWSQGQVLDIPDWF